MSKEIYHEGWLIKSPPKSSIWWPKQYRRRWFTLKQGEIPEQFCLEYYEDRNCRILKGVIDLDHCDQVDLGLQLERKKQKFQHMFDVKTPKRTYYLAAETEADMIEWVNSICAVCNLHDLSKQQATTSESRQCYNVRADAIVNQPQAPLSRREHSSTGPSSSMDMKPSPGHMSLSRAQENSALYQNFDAPLRQPSYTTRETMMSEASLAAPAQPSASNQKEEYYNSPAIAEANRTHTFERSHSLRTAGANAGPDASGTNLSPSHGRTQSLVEQKSNMPAFGRKIPENLKLNERGAAKDGEPSPALSTSSGPYIAISECISGHSLIDKDPPATPLNSLDPKFYETPRNHVNIGLNLTANEQPYSPKRHNGPAPQQGQSRSGRSSPTDSESVFTDDEDWVATSPSEGTIDRRLRPSDSSVENDSIVYTYAQRFSKMPSENDETGNDKLRHKRPAAVLVLGDTNGGENNKETNSSDTENASPAMPIGPKDMRSCVEENYDIPRSHQMPYYNLNNGQDNDDDHQLSPTLSTLSDAITASTPNLTERFSTMSMTSTPSSKFSTMQHRSRPHFYTNAAPTKVEGNVFRYDFDEQVEAPVVNRQLKPRIEEKTPRDVTRPVSIISTTSINSGQPDMHPYAGPPCIDRKLKPATPLQPFETNSLRRGGGSNMLSHTTTDSEFHTDHGAAVCSKTLPRNYNNPSMATASTAPTGTKQIGKLEYFDLDHSNPPPICKNASNSSASSSNLSAALTVGLPIVAPTSRGQSHRASGFGLPSTSASGSSLARSHGDGGMGTPLVTGTGIVYKSVDFIKTEAFMRTRQDAEKNRNLKNQTKD